MWYYHFGRSGRLSQKVSAIRLKCGMVDSIWEGGDLTRAPLG